MTNYDKADFYFDCLDRLLKGETDVGPIEDADVASLVKLSKNMIEAGERLYGRHGEVLRKQILLRIKSAEAHENDGELSDSDLMVVTAALPDMICPYCGALLDKRYGSCPICQR